MEPAIGRSVGSGFRAAWSSWAAIGVFAGIWILLTTGTWLVLLATGIPGELFMARPAVELTTATPAPVATTPAVADRALEETVAEEELLETKEILPQPAETPEIPLESDASEEATQEPPSLYEQMQATEPLALQTPIQPETASDEELDRLMEEWVSKAWPALLLISVITLLVMAWLIAGQIGFLSAAVMQGHASLSDYWKSASQGFLRLLGSLLLSTLLWIGVVLSGVLLLIGLSVLAAVIPKALMGLVGLFFALVLFVGLVWIGVRFSFWFIAVVMDRVGPVAGLKASYRATRGRWWKTLGLQAILGLILLGVVVLMRVLELLVISGGMGVLAVLIFSSALLMVVLLLTTFVSVAATIRFYADAKTAQ